MRRNLFGRITRWWPHFLTLLLWPVLTGQKSQSGNFQLSDLEANYGGPAVVPTSFYVTIFFIVGGLVGGFFYLKRYREQQAMAEQKRIAREKVEHTLSTIYESLKMEEGEVELVRRLAGEREADDLLSMMRNNKIFEEAVQEFWEREELDEETQTALHAMRHKLQFIISNKDCSVVSTKMLVPNMRLECQVAVKGRQLAFISLVKDVTEGGVRIDPPMIKRRPANLKQFKKIKCRIRRHGDADYEFSLNVKEQKAETPSVVWLSHSSDIRKMAIRESERIEMKQAANLRRVDPNDYDLRERLNRRPPEEYNIKSTIVDMSAGGMKLLVKQKMEDPLKPGDILLFHLHGASLREDLAANVVGAIQRDKHTDIHLQFRDNSTLTRIKLLQYLHRLKKQQNAAA
jgi:c-di-GMP-binding flagellar brake protein YcgR